MGVVYLLTLLIPTLNWVFVFSSFLSTGGTVAANILEKEILFRFNITNQVLGSVCILLLGFLLHINLKNVNRNISLVALFFKSSEAMISLAMALVYFMVLSLIKADVIESSVMKTLIENYVSYTALPGIFLGLSMVLFCLLFYKSGIIPNWMAIWGIIAYVMVIVYDGSVILSPGNKPVLWLQVTGTAPVCLFQITTSLHLIFSNKKILSIINSRIPGLKE